MGPDARPTGKAELRAALTAARQARTAAELAGARTAIRGHVLDRCAREGWRCVAGYVPLRTEPGSPELLAGLRTLGVRVLVPVLLADRDLDWAEWGAGSPAAPLGPDAIGAADAVLVPALAVARDGARLGRGGGSYDRALRRAAPAARRAALIYADELRARLPVDAWDVPVTDAVTPSGWHPLPVAPAGLDGE